MYKLQYSGVNSRLELINLKNSKILPIFVDFSSSQMAWRSNLQQSQLIAKAIGKKNLQHQQKAKGSSGDSNNSRLHVIDATAGFGVDAFIIAKLGCKVTLIEQSPIMAKLLADGLKRGKEDLKIKSIIDNMQLITGNSIEYLQHQDIIGTYPDIIYLDPMFPKSRKSALTNKNITTLKNILNSDSITNSNNCSYNDVLLLQTAIKVAKLKVIVKRHKNSASLAPKIPVNYSIAGKTCRFDIYTL